MGTLEGGLPTLGTDGYHGSLHGLWEYISVWVGSGLGCPSGLDPPTPTAQLADGCPQPLCVEAAQGASQRGTFQS